MKTFIVVVVVIVVVVDLQTSLSFRWGTILCIFRFLDEQRIDSEFFYVVFDQDEQLASALPSLNKASV